MLRGLRKASSGVLGKAIMGVVVGVLVLAFAIWGIGDMFRGYGRSTVAKVGNTEISVEQFRQAYNDRLQQVGRQLGRPLTAAQARDLGLERQLASQLVAEATIDEKARQMGLRLSDAEIARVITNDPNFRGPNGQFNRQQFDMLIRNAGFTEARFTAEQRRVTLRRELSFAIGGDAPAPKASAEALNRYENEQRAVDYAVLGPAQAGDIPAPTPEVLAKYFEERKALFRAPEYRKVVVLTLLPSDLDGTIEVSDADVRRAYDERRSQYGTPERRELQQIVFPNAPEAKAAADRLAGGLTFEALATERNLKPGDINLGTVNKTELVDRTVADAAFALKEGEVSAPIAGRFGTALVRVVKVEPERIRPFEELAPEIKRNLTRDRARPELQNLHDKVEDERASGLSLEEVGRKLKLKVRTIDAIDRSGRDPAGASVGDLPAGADVVAAAFATDVGVENDPLQTSAGGYVWYDVIATTPSRERALDEVKDRVEARWHDDQVAERLTKVATEMLDKLKAGGTLADAAAGHGVTAATAFGLKRGHSSDPLSAKVVDTVFRLPKGGSGFAEGRSPAERVVVRVTDIVAPNFDPASPEGKRYIDGVARALNEELFLEYVTRVGAEIGTSINQEALARAVGGSEQ